VNLPSGAKKQVLPSRQNGVRSSGSVLAVWGVSVLLGQHTLPALPQFLGTGWHCALPTFSELQKCPA
jgi:hypothetical protein